MILNLLSGISCLTVMILFTFFVNNHDIFSITAFMLFNALAIINFYFYFDEEKKKKKQKKISDYQ